MTLPDVNILVSAFRRDSAHHGTCRKWLDDTINGEAQFGIAPQVLGSVVRIVTHPKIFAEPSTLTESLDFCELLLSVPQCAWVQPGERHWGIFARVSGQSDARGNLVPDAWFAALAIESGCEWITLDRDFSRFEGLRWRLPN